MRGALLTKYLGIVVLTGIVVAVAFGSSIDHEFVTWDDTILITENPIVQTPSLKNVVKAFTSYDPELYIPLTFVSYQINSVVCGLSPSCFHATDLVLHTLNAVLVYALFASFIGSDLIALVLALLFAVHPLNTEAVVWASARKDTLSTLFFLSSLLAYIQTRSAGKAHRWLLTSIILFMLGLLSKVSIIMLPVVLLLIDVLEQRRDYRKMIIEKLPYIALAILFGIVAIIGKSSVLESTSLTEKILMGMRSTMFYLTAFALPVNLSVMVPYSGEISLVEPAFYLSAIVLIIAFGATVALRRRVPTLFFGALFFIVTLAPSFTNFAKGGDIYIASDRYAYVPMLGLLLLIGFALQSFLEGSKTKRVFQSRQRILAGVLIFIVGVSLKLSHAQAETWKNSETLFTHTVSLYPGARAALTNLGMEKLKKGEYREALRLFDESLVIKNDVSVRANRASALYLGGDTASAKKEYASILKENPTLAEAHYNLGNIARREKQLTEAIQYYKDALAIDPTYFNALNNLASLYAETGDMENTANTYAFLSDAYPDSADSAFNAGVASEHLKQFTIAQKYYERAMKADPTDATTLASLATVLYEQGQIDPSARTLMQAIDLDPNNTIAITLALRMKKDGYAK